MLQTQKTVNRSFLGVFGVFLSDNAVIIIVLAAFTLARSTAAGLDRPVQFGEGCPMTSEPIRIQRYPNRRLYDRAHRRYVTLAEIEALVRQGRVIRVQDSKTGEDLTRQVLTQILLERHPEKMELFPIPLLHGLLRANDLATGLWEAYLRQALLALENLQRTVSPLSAPLAWLPTWLPGWTTPPAGATEPLADRLAALEDRIAQLETQSSNAGGAPSESENSATLGDLERRVNGLEESPAI